MASLFGSLLSRVFKVTINGNITQNMTEQIFYGLSSAKFFKPEAITIVINSPGGSLTQAKSISDLLKNYSEKKNIPIYSFAEDSCLGSANVLLTTGAKAYTSEMTMLGDFNFSWNSLWFKKFADKYNIRQEFIYSGENKVKFNPFEDIKPQSEKWMQNYLYLLEHQLKVCVTRNRLSHFKKRQMDNKDTEEKIFSGLLLKPQKALELGYIDGFKTFDEIMKSSFKGVKVHEINKKNKIKSALQGAIL